MKGSIILLLHAHLPYVRHLEHEYCIEENWLFEAIIETYVPLLAMMERLVSDGISPRLTLSLSPTLVEMLNDEMLRKRFIRRLEGLISLSEAEVDRTGKSMFGHVASLYNKHFKTVKELYTRQYECDLVSVFRRLQDGGHIEITATAATHAFLPAFEAYPDIIKDQVEIGIAGYKRNFGRAPSGFWLPECGYFRELDFILEKAGIKYFFLDSHGMLMGDPQPPRAVFAPVKSPAGLTVFGRDTKSAKQVWDASEGYPGDPHYRDFYRDIGFDLPSDYIDQFLHTGDLKLFTGMKYYRITGAADSKLPYVRAGAVGRAIEHAGHFVKSMEDHAAKLGWFGFDPVILSPFDAELFGHWWFEGTQWLEMVIRKLSGSNGIGLATPAECAMTYPSDTVIDPHPSSWGEGGYGTQWIGEKSHYIYRHLHGMAERMALLEQSLPKTPGRTIKRIIKLAKKEMLRAQASDWPFMIEKNRSAGYAEKIMNSHIANFNRLFSMAKETGSDQEWLKRLEESNNIFEWIND